MEKYVTYDPATGSLTGAFQQDVQPDHVAVHIPISGDVHQSWPLYRANDARDGVELLPPVVYPLPPQIEAAIAKTYRDVDSIYTAAVGNRTDEYREAEDAARAYVAAGYTGSVSAYVSDFALSNPTGVAQTDAWSADQIIARADAFHAAKLSMRSRRFSSQADMRAANTMEELNAAVADWSGFIVNLRAQLGL